MFRVSGAPDDVGAADLAGWRFIKESDFTAGARQGGGRGLVCGGQHSGEVV